MYTCVGAWSWVNGERGYYMYTCVGAYPELVNIEYLRDLNNISQHIYRCRGLAWVSEYRISARFKQYITAIYIQV
jgi:hypothetical protein